MSAVYGLPDHLIEHVKTGVQIAANIAEPEDGDLNGVLISDLASRWEELVRVHHHHYDLLSPAECAELHAVIMLAAEYAEDNNYDAETDAEDFPEDFEFTLSAEELVATLLDLSQRASVPVAA